MIEYENLNFKIEYNVYVTNLNVEAYVYVNNNKISSLKNTPIISQTLEFTYNCEFNKKHNLTLEFVNTDQLNFVKINRILIDGINVREVINAYRTFTTNDGITIFPKIPSDIADGLINKSGIWNLPFYNPFYKFLINWVNDEHNEFYNDKNINYII